MPDNTNMSSTKNTKNTKDISEEEAEDVSEKEEEEEDTNKKKEKSLKVNISHISWNVKHSLIDVKALKKVTSDLNDINENILAETKAVPSRTSNITAVNNYAAELEGAAELIQVQINELIRCTGDLLNTKNTYLAYSKELRGMKPSKNPPTVK